MSSTKIFPIFKYTFYITNDGRVIAIIFSDAYVYIHE